MTSTNNTAPSVGAWVQFNPNAQSIFAPKPTPTEATIGLVRQLFTAEGQQFYQVVWNPGSAFPQTGLYTIDQLCVLTQQDAATIMNELNSGTYQPPSGDTNT